MATTSTCFTEYGLPIELYDGVRVDVSSKISLPHSNNPYVTSSLARQPATRITCAEFFRLIGRHRLPVFQRPLRSLSPNGGPLNQGGTYETRWAEMEDDLVRSTQDGRTNPFVLKCQRRRPSYFRPEGSSFVKAGTIVVSKHVKNVAPKTDGSYDIYSTLMKEALVLSHHTIQRSLFFPSFFGFAFEESPGHFLHQSPILLLEMGDGGNLEEWFRGMWRGNLPQLPRQLERGQKWLHSTGSPLGHLVFDWERKMRMATCIASAIATLHKAGVVHGDVKMENVICCPFNPDSERPHSRQFPQLCDFGSCILLSELPLGSRRKLISHTPPWNAPESLSDLDMKGLLKTDIYSFGLLLARILLDGNDPFSEDYHISSGASAEYDWSQIKELTENGLVPEHVIGRILSPLERCPFIEDGVYGDTSYPYSIIDDPGFDGCLYSVAQRSVIRSLMRVTLQLLPQRRLGNMSLMVEFLRQTITTDEDRLDRQVAPYPQTWLS